MSFFTDIAHKEFAFLGEDYGFTAMPVESDEEVLYLNGPRGVAVRIERDFMAGYIFIFIYRMVNGRVRRNQLPITDKSEISEIDFTDVLPMEVRMRPSYEYPEDSVYFSENGLQHFVADFALRLREYGHRLLSGDFSEFPKVERIIKERAREMR